jgi:hypothetical protein
MLTAAEEDIENGRTISTEKLREKLREWKESRE